MLCCVYYVLLVCFCLVRVREKEMHVFGYVFLAVWMQWMLGYV